MLTSTKQSVRLISTFQVLIASFSKNAYQPTKLTLSTSLVSLKLKRLNKQSLDGESPPKLASNIKQIQN